jgi:hypothetical protein
MLMPLSEIEPLGFHIPGQEVVNTVDRVIRKSEKRTTIVDDRGGRALLAGLICCTRCGRRLVLAYAREGPVNSYGFS